MQEYFERELITVEQELRCLKTSSQRSSGAIVVTSQTMHLTVPLEYIHKPPLNDQARAERWYEVITDKTSLIIPTLSWYFQDLSQASSTIFTTRMVELLPAMLPNGNYGISLYFIGSEVGDDNDAAKLARGETVNIDVDLTVTCTSDFTIREYAP